MTAPALDRLRDEILAELEQLVRDAYADHADDCTDRPDELLDDPVVEVLAAWLETILSEVRRYRHIPADVLAGLLDGTHGWQPMASAGEGPVIVAHTLAWSPNEVFQCVCWRIGTTGPWQGGVSGFTPIAWHPLPAPPKQEGRA